TKPACEDEIRRANPDIILHIGAYTNVDQAERDPEQAHAVNAKGTRWVSQAAKAVKARLVYLSTDYVFDGMKTSPYHEQDPPHPPNHDGLSQNGREQHA